MDAFVKLVDEMKKAYGQSVVNFSEMQPEVKDMKRAYLQINFSKFSELMQFYGKGYGDGWSVVSSFFTRVMEFYRSCSVSCMNDRYVSSTSVRSVSSTNVRSVSCMNACPFSSTNARLRSLSETRTPPHFFPHAVSIPTKQLHAHSEADCAQRSVLEERGGRAHPKRPRVPERRSGHFAGAQRYAERPSVRGQRTTVPDPTNSRDRCEQAERGVDHEEGRAR